MKLPLCLGAVAVKMSNYLHIFWQKIVSDKTKFNWNESILQKKPTEKDLHVHARTSRIHVYFF